MKPITLPPPAVICATGWRPFSSLIIPAAHGPAFLLTNR